MLSLQQEYQLRATKAKFIITHTASLDTAVTAARALGSRLFQLDRIALIQPPKHTHHPASAHFHSPSANPLGKEALEATRQNAVTVQSLIERGLGDLNANGPHFVERKLGKDEAKTKLAFLSFSSGTTGKPKVCPYFDISDLLYWVSSVC